MLPDIPPTVHRAAPTTRDNLAIIPMSRNPTRAESMAEMKLVGRNGEV